MISCCGMVCMDCERFSADCTGCATLEGRVFWLRYVDDEVCPIYACCVEARGLPHCGRCEELPCANYSKYQDPSVLPEEDKACLERQIALLSSLD